MWRGRAPPCPQTRPCCERDLKLHRQQIASLAQFSVASAAPRMFVSIRSDQYIVSTVSVYICHVSVVWSERVSREQEVALLSFCYVVVVVCVSSLTD